MAETSEKTTGTGNTAAPNQGDHDRVAMLSLRADGSPDQHNPEFIGDREFALAATREQFRQQAVSAADVANRGDTADTGAEEVGQDPVIAELQQAHESVSADADAAATAAVDALYTGEAEPATDQVTQPSNTSTGQRPGGRAKSGS